MAIYTLPEGLFNLPSLAALQSGFAGVQNFAPIKTDAPAPVVTATAPNAQPATKAEAKDIPARYTDIEVVKAPTADADQAQEPDKYFATDSQTGDRVELLKASEYPVGKGPSGTEWLARRAGDMITTPDGNFLPFEALDSKGNIIGTWNMQKNELSDFAKTVGTATKIAAIAGTGYALGSAAGLFGDAAAASASAGSSVAPGSLQAALSELGVTQAAGASAVPGSLQSLLPSLGVNPAIAGGVATGTAGLLSGAGASSNILSSLGEIGTNLNSSLGQLGTGISTIGEGLGTGLTGLGEGLGQIGTGLVSGLEGIGTGLGQGIAGIGEGLGTLGSGIGTGISGLGGAVGDVLGGIGGTVGDVLGGVTGLFGGLGNTVGSVLGGLTQASTASSLSNLFSNLVNAGIDADTARRLADQQIDLGNRLNAAAQAVAAGQQVDPATVANLTALTNQAQADLRSAATNAQLPPETLNQLLTAANTAQQQILTGAQQAQLSPQELANLRSTATDAQKQIIDAAAASRLPPEQLASYQQLAQTTAGQFAQAGAEAASQFTPYTVTTGAGTARVAPGSATVSAAGPYAGLQQQALAGASTAFGAAGQGGDYAQTLYNQARALQAPQEARQQEQLLSSLGARGLLGIGRNMPTVGGATTAVNPYVESLLSAQRTADANLALQSQQAGTSEALRQAQLGQGLLGSAQGIDQQAAALLGQASGLSAQQTAIQQANNQARLQATLQGLGLPLQAQQNILALQQADAGRQLQAQMAASQLPYSAEQQALALRQADLGRQLGATTAAAQLPLQAQQNVLNMQQQGLLSTLPTFNAASQLPLQNAFNVAQMQQNAQRSGLQAQIAGLGYQALAGLNAADIQAGRTSGISQGVKSAIPGLFGNLFGSSGVDLFNLGSGSLNGSAGYWD